MPGEEEKRAPKRKYVEDSSDDESLSDSELQLSPQRASITSPFTNDKSTPVKSKLASIASRLPSSGSTPVKSKPPSTDSRVSLLNTRASTHPDEPGAPLSEKVSIFYLNTDINLMVMEANISMLYV